MMAERTDDFEFWPAEDSSGPSDRQAMDIKLIRPELGIDLEPLVLPEAAFGTNQPAATLPEGASLIQSSGRQDLNPTHQEQIVVVHLPIGIEAMDVQQIPVNPPPSAGPVISEEQAFQSKAGYDHNFHDRERASEYNCQICLSVSRDPQQTKCCGGTFCLYCIERALQSSKASMCPICNKGPVELIPDKAQKQKINKLKVQCPIEGCTWIVDLADIEAHTKKPHPLSPPLSTPHSTLQRKQQRQTQQLHYNTLPPPHRQEQPQSGISVDRPVLIPTPQTATPECEQDNINMPVFQPAAEQGEHSQSVERETHDYHNLTFPRPRVPRIRSPSPQPDPKRVKMSPYVNISGPDFPTSPPPQGQPLIPLNEQTADGSSSEAHECETPTCDNLLQLTPEEEESNYVNVPLRPRNRPQSPPYMSQASQEVQSSQHLPSEISTNSEQPSEPQLYQQLPDQPPIDPQPLPLDQISGGLVPVPNEMAANLPAQDEFSQFPFQPRALSPTAADVPIQVSQDSSETAHIPHIETETENSEIPSLPPDLLALLNDQTSQQYQAEVFSSNPFMNNEVSGFILSPSPPSRLQSPLLPAPLLDLIQPEAEEPTPQLNSSLPRSSSPYENTSPPPGTNEAEQSPGHSIGVTDYSEVSHEADWPDYVNAAPLQQMEPSQPLSTAPYENITVIPQGGDESNPSPAQWAENVEISDYYNAVSLQQMDPFHVETTSPPSLQGVNDNDSSPPQQMNQADYYNAATLQQFHAETTSPPPPPQGTNDTISSPAQQINQSDYYNAASLQQMDPFHAETTSPPPLQGMNDTISPPGQQISEANYVDMTHYRHEENQPDFVNAASPEQNDSEYYVCVSQPEANEEITAMNLLQDANQLLPLPITSQPNYSNVCVPSSPDVVQHQEAEYVDMQTVPQTLREDASQPQTAREDASQSQTVLADISQPPTERVDVSRAEANDVPARPPISQQQLPAQPNRSPSPQYETIPGPPQCDIPDEHIYEPLRPAFSTPPPPESPQPDPPALPRAGVAPPTPTEQVDAPPPLLPPRNSDPPAAQPEQNTPPDVPLRTRTPTAEPTVTAETQQAQVAPSVPTQHDQRRTQQNEQTRTQPAQTEAENQAEAVANNQILQEIRQGNADDPFLRDLPPPQYDDLSQRYDHRVLTPPPAHPQSPRGEALIIRNDNVGNVSPPPLEGPIRMENVNIQYERGGNVDHRNRKTQIILWLFFSVLLAVLWFILVIPLSIAALLDALEKIKQDRDPLIPSCDYSVPLLLVVILTQVLAAIFIIYWFSKCCKCARSRKASRVATSMTAVTAVMYGVVIIAFAVSVFVFLNKTTNEDSEDSTSTTPNSNGIRSSVSARMILPLNLPPTSGYIIQIRKTRQNTNSNDDTTQETDSTVCIRSSSSPFLFATFYLLALLVFLVLGVLTTCCDYHYKKTHKNFLKYLQDMVRIYENEGRDDREGHDETVL